MNENMNKLQEVLKEEGFLEKLAQAESAEAAQAMLKEKGVDMSVEELNQMVELVQKVVNGDMTVEQLEQAQTGELSEDDLESVAGGMSTKEKVIFGVATAGAVVFLGVLGYFGGSVDGYQDATAGAANKIAGYINAATRW